MNRRLAAALALIATTTTLWALAGAAPSPGAARPAGNVSKSERPRWEKVVKTDAEWKQILSPEQYRVLRRKGTEVAFTGDYWKLHDHGTYRCAGCGLELFASDTKFDSGTGWPSYWAPIAKANVHEDVDRTLGMVRTEVSCARCGGHLGHLFEDGPQPTGMRYCINSAALKFEKRR